MTKRLEQAINRLTTSQVEQLTKLAETFTQQNESPQAKTWKFDWIGALAGSSEKSGVEAQRIAMTEWEDMIDGGRCK